MRGTSREEHFTSLRFIFLKFYFMILFIQNVQNIRLILIGDVNGMWNKGVHIIILL